MVKCEVPVNAMKAYRVELQYQSLFTFYLAGCEWSASNLGHIALGKEPPVPTEQEGG
jgi:hypothetical protein